MLRIDQREMIDMVPKAITLTLVNYAKENLQRVLLEHLYSKPLPCIYTSRQHSLTSPLTEPEILEELLKESPDIVARRKECVKMVGALNQAEAMYVQPTSMQSGLLTMSILFVSSIATV
jgi:hypothetical protein